MLLAVSWNTCDAALKDFLWFFVENILAVNEDFTGIALFQSCQNFNKLCLSISIDTGKTYNLPASN